MKSKKIKYVIGIVFILLGIGIVSATLLPDSMQYYVTVTELMARQSELQNKKLKVAGTVKEGSLQKLNEGLRVRFDVIHEKDIVTVTYEGALPDTFKEGVEVVVTGRLIENHQVVATEVLAKCASRYEEKLDPKLDETSNKKV